MDKQIILIGVAAVLAVGLLVGLTSTDTATPDIQEKGKVAVIQLSGTITPSTSGSPFSPQSGITPAKLRSLTEKADKKQTDAIIYEFNSGGGAVVASKDLMRTIERVEKPTICRFRDIAASGAYLASLGCDHVVADSASLTGSIGVKSSYLEYSGLLNKLGVEYVNISSGSKKEVGTPYKNITESEKELLQEKANQVHEEFIQLVRENRELSDQRMEEVSTGEAFLGDNAKELGLVDSLGGRYQAVKVAENMTGKDLETVKVEQKSDLDLLSLLSGSGVRSLLGNIFSAGSPLQATWR